MDQELNYQIGYDDGFKGVKPRDKYHKKYMAGYHIGSSKRVSLQNEVEANPEIKVPDELKHEKAIVVEILQATLPKDSPVELIEKLEKVEDEASIATHNAAIEAQTGIYVSDIIDSEISIAAQDIATQTSSGHEIPVQPEKSENPKLNAIDQDDPLDENVHQIDSVVPQPADQISSNQAPVSVDPAVNVEVQAKSDSIVVLDPTPTQIVVVSSDTQDDNVSVPQVPSETPTNTTETNEISVLPVVDSQPVESSEPVQTTTDANTNTGDNQVQTVSETSMEVTDSSISTPVVVDSTTSTVDDQSSNTVTTPVEVLEIAPQTANVEIDDPVVLPETNSSNVAPVIVETPIVPVLVQFPEQPSIVPADANSSPVDLSIQVEDLSQPDVVVSPDSSIVPPIVPVSDLPTETPKDQDQLSSELNQANLSVIPTDPLVSTPMVSDSLDVSSNTIPVADVLIVPVQDEILDQQPQSVEVVSATLIQETSNVGIDNVNIVQATNISSSNSTPVEVHPTDDHSEIPTNPTDQLDPVENQPAIRQDTNQAESVLPVTEVSSNTIPVEVVRVDAPASNTEQTLDPIISPNDAGTQNGPIIVSETTSEQTNVSSNSTPEVVEPTIELIVQDQEPNPISTPVQTVDSVVEVQNINFSNTVVSSETSNVAPNESVVPPVVVLEANTEQNPTIPQEQIIVVSPTVETSSAETDIFEPTSNVAPVEAPSVLVTEPAPTVNTEPVEVVMVPSDTPDSNVVITTPEVVHELANVNFDTIQVENANVQIITVPANTQLTSN